MKPQPLGKNFAPCETLLYTREQPVVLRVVSGEPKSSKHAELRLHSLRRSFQMVDSLLMVFASQAHPEDRLAPAPAHRGMDDNPETQSKFDRSLHNQR
jgi:hypothetical protein